MQNPGPSDFVKDHRARIREIFSKEQLAATDRAAALQAAAELDPFAGPEDMDIDATRELVPGYNAPSLGVEQPESEISVPTIESLGLVRWEHETASESAALEQVGTLISFAEDLVRSQSIFLDSVTTNKSKVVVVYRPFRAAMSVSSDSATEQEPAPKRQHTVKWKPTPPAAPSPAALPAPPPAPGPSSAPGVACDFCAKKVTMKGYGNRVVEICLTDYGCPPAKAIEYGKLKGKEDWLTDPAVDTDKKVYWLMTQHSQTKRLLKGMSPLRYP
ncbi:MAG: hypothetical protein [Nanning Rhabd tick virus 1]|uniref:Phosphoprotein n=1 Tax=Nanning Rhabd tick virus 1 TaxID=2972321 RepID=A0A9E7V289_9RHAB|nr:MAG: hypothetical protein [Nanning Rhabd tick virus 1]